MPDPITIAIAAAIAGKAAESLTDQAKDAVTRLAHLVRAKFRHRPADLAALDAAQQQPDSAERTAELADALQSAAGDDPAFDADIRALWDQARIHTTVAGDGVANVFQGRADKVVQLRDVHGDLNIG